MTRQALSARARVDWLQLARTPRVGPVTFRDLLDRYQSAEAALEALPRLARRAGGKPPAIPPRSRIEDEIERTRRLDGVVLCACEPAYPVLLAALDPPPPVITVLGRGDVFTTDAVALVGARNASAVGQRFARETAFALAEAGWLVVSGLARGLDAAAHAGALAAASGGTLAVVAGGADIVYPEENAALRENIATHGAIVSERPLGAHPGARDFPRRNRLISGLSRGVVVIEAARKSGSLITARYAGEQGREVMAAPGSPLDPRARGANHLIREGAALIESADDVLEVLAATRPPASGAQEPVSRTGYAAAPPDDDALARQAESVRAAVLAALSPTPIHVDEIVRAAGGSSAAVAAALVELELAGLAVRGPGGQVARLDPPAPGSRPADQPDLF